MEPGQDPIVSAEWLKQNLNAPDVRVLDATWYPGWIPRSSTAQRDYLLAHIPGASFFDIDEIADKSTDLPHMLPPPELFSSRMKRLGIGDGHRVVVYDRNDFMASARVWWTLRVMGHRDVFVLNGGWQAWLDAGGETEDLPPLTSERHHTVRVQRDLVRSRDQVRDAIENNAVTIVDARPAPRFEGRAPEPREGLASGHIPGSVNVPSSSLVRNGLLLAPDEIKAVFNEAGVDTQGQIITTCGSGVTAAILSLALARIGNPFAAVYDGSWSEWGAAPDKNPVASAVA